MKNCNFAASSIFSKRKIPINLRGSTTRPKKEQSFPRKSFPRSSCSYQQISDCVCSHHSLLLTLFVFCTSKSSEQTNFFPKKKLSQWNLVSPSRRDISNYRIFVSVWESIFIAKLFRFYLKREFLSLFCGLFSTKNALPENKPKWGSCISNLSYFYCVFLPSYPNT